MTAIPEQHVLTAMGDEGLRLAVEAVADLLVSIGYHDAAKELRARYDDASGIEVEYD
jgi:hypothetical protein